MPCVWQHRYMFRAAVAALGKLTSAEKRLLQYLGAKAASIPQRLRAVLGKASPVQARARS
jgi:ABC-type Fe2+-enterobactin transport system substrate-binding protein